MMREKFPDTRPLGELSSVALVINKDGARFGVRVRSWRSYGKIEDCKQSTMFKVLLVKSAQFSASVYCEICILELEGPCRGECSTPVAQPVRDRTGFPVV